MRLRRDSDRDLGLGFGFGIQFGIWVWDLVWCQHDLGLGLAAWVQLTPILRMDPKATRAPPRFYVENGTSLKEGVVYSEGRVRGDCESETCSLH